jgi:hypothetical protein
MPATKLGGAARKAASILPLPGIILNSPNLTLTINALVYMSTLPRATCYKFCIIFEDHWRLPSSPLAP